MLRTPYRSNMSKLLAGWIAITANYFAREAGCGWWAEVRSATIAETIPETIEATPAEQLKRSGLRSSYVGDIWSYPLGWRSRGAEEQQDAGILHQEVVCTWTRAHRHMTTHTDRHQQLRAIRGLRVSLALASGR